MKRVDATRTPTSDSEDEKDASAPHGVASLHHLIASAQYRITLLRRMWCAWKLYTDHIHPLEEQQDHCIALSFWGAQVQATMFKAWHWRLHCRRWLLEAEAQAARHVIRTVFRKFRNVTHQQRRLRLETYPQAVCCAQKRRKRVLWDQWCNRTRNQRQRAENLREAEGTVRAILCAQRKRRILTEWFTLAERYQRQRLILEGISRQRREQCVNHAFRQLRGYAIYRRAKVLWWGVARTIDRRRLLLKAVHFWKRQYLQRAHEVAMLQRAVRSYHNHLLRVAIQNLRDNVQIGRVWRTLVNEALERRRVRFLHRGVRTWLEVAQHIHMQRRRTALEHDTVCLARERLLALRVVGRWRALVARRQTQRSVAEQVPRRSSGTSRWMKEQMPPWCSISATLPNHVNSPALSGFGVRTLKAPSNPRAAPRPLIRDGNGERRMSVKSGMSTNTAVGGSTLDNREVPSNTAMFQCCGENTEVGGESDPSPLAVSRKSVCSSPSREENDVRIHHNAVRDAGDDIPVKRAEELSVEQFQRILSEFAELRQAYTTSKKRKEFVLSKLAESEEQSAVNRCRLLQELDAIHALEIQYQLARLNVERTQQKFANKLQQWSPAHIR